MSRMSDCLLFVPPLHEAATCEQEIAFEDGEVVDRGGVLAVVAEGVLLSMS